LTLPLEFPAGNCGIALNIKPIRHLRFANAKNRLHTNWKDETMRFCLIATLFVGLALLPGCTQKSTVKEESKLTTPTGTTTITTQKEIKKTGDQKTPWEDVFHSLMNTSCRVSFFGKVARAVGVISIARADFHAVSNICWMPSATAIGLVTELRFHLNGGAVRPAPRKIEMLIRLRFNEAEICEKTVQLHGELPTPGSIIEFEGRTFAISALPTSWVFQDGELVPVLHVILKSEQWPVKWRSLRISKGL
jgi:hypothetical protein